MPDAALTVTVLKGATPDGERRFTGNFIVGRTRECDLQIRDTSISRRHVMLEFTGGAWWLTDLQSANGTFLDGQRVQTVQILDRAVIELGKDGPQLALVPDGAVSASGLPQPAAPPPREEEPEARPQPLVAPGPGRKPRANLGSETQIMKHYFTTTGDPESAGETTLMIRRAFQRATQKQSKKYRYVIGAALLLLAVAGAVIGFERQKLQKLRLTAEDIFYVMKGLELQIGQLEEVVLLGSNPAELALLKEKRDRVRNMEKQYDTFVKELGIYARLSAEERVIMRVAHRFGECEANMPQGFSDQVKTYIALWKSSDRLQKALGYARQRGYAPLITGIFRDNDLPPQYFYLALQESNFDERAVGPATRFGNAKGMWQFLAPTAQEYGLHLGALPDKPVYDPKDDRFDPAKATLAAAKYIKGLNNTAAQASGLLVMASYNWGEGNVIKIIDQMPPNPRERNFWRLLSMKNIPKETYDYVFSIFSAAVICEEPQLFGFAGDCPDVKDSGMPQLRDADHPKEPRPGAER